MLFVPQRSCASAGFFHEWLTGKTLNVPDAPSGNYVEAIDSAKYLVASHAVRQALGAKADEHESLPFKHQASSIKQRHGVN